MRSRRIWIFALATVLLLLVGVQLASGVSTKLPSVMQSGNQQIAPPDDPVYGGKGNQGQGPDVLCSNTDLTKPAEEPSCPPPDARPTRDPNSDTTGEENGPPTDAPASTSP
jgi:hypothetical protein